MLAYFNALTLGTLSVCSFFYLNHMNRRTPHMKRWGVVLITSGSACEALSWFIAFKTVEYEWAWLPEAVLHLGLALVALAIVQGNLTEYFNCMTERWNGAERRASSRRHAGD